MKKIVTVIHGPGVWVGLRGWWISQDAEFVVGRFWSRDDAGNGVYDVRLPLACVKIEDEPVAA